MRHTALGRNLGPLIITAALLSGCGSDPAGPLGTPPDVTSPIEGLSNANNKKCLASDLEARVQDGQDKDGSKAFTIKLTSKSDVKCSTRGVPTVQLLDGETPVVSGSAVSSASNPEVSLSPGDSAYFDLGYPTGGDSCPTVNFLYIAVPDDSQTLRLPLEGDQVGSVCTDATVSASLLRDSD